MPVFSLILFRSSSPSIIVIIVESIVDGLLLSVRTYWRLPSIF